MSQTEVSKLSANHQKLLYELYQLKGDSGSEWEEFLIAHSIEKGTFLKEHLSDSPLSDVQDDIGNTASEETSNNTEDLKIEVESDVSQIKVENENDKEQSEQEGNEPMDVDIESSSKLETKSSIEEDLGDISQQNDTNQESISQQQDMESSMIVDGDTMKQSNKENQPRQSNGSEIDVNSKDELSPESVPIGNDHIFEGQQMITDQPTYISTPFHSRFTELGTMDSPLSPIKRRKLFTESSLQTPFSVKSSKKLSHLDKFKTPLKQTTIATPKPSQKSRSSFEQGYKGYQLMAEKLNIVNKSMVSVLPQSHKVLTTRNWRVGHEEIRFTNIMDRVEKLKEEQLWSFKQLKKHVHPPRPKLQWDYMLEEMQWLSEDFRQEKKWKIVAAHNMANWVMDWHKSIDKSTVCIKYRPIQYLEEKKEEIESQLIDLAEAGSPTGQDLDVDSSLVLDVNNQVEQIPIKPDDKPPVSVWKVPITNNASIETASLTKPIIIDFESNLYSMEGSDDTKLALSHISTYGPPVYSEGQLYIEDDSIVPISHLMLGQCILEEGSRWDQFGQFRESFVPEPPTPKLPSLDRYNTSNESHALFGGTVIEDDDELLPNDTKAGSSNPSNIPFPPPNCLKPDHAQISAPWGLDEQDALWQLTSVYSGNWNLIAESLNSCRFSSNSNRTNWCCFNKYVELNESSYKPVGKSDYLYSTASQTKAEKKAKVLKIFSTFTFIGSMAKKRDASRSHVPKSNKQVNLQAHDTHKHSQVAAGVDVNMRPFDIGKLKERRDLANEQMRNNQLFNSSRHAGMAVRPAVPGMPQFRPMMSNRMNGLGNIPIPGTPQHSSIPLSQHQLLQPPMNVQQQAMNQARNQMIQAGLSAHQAAGLVGSNTPQQNMAQALAMQGLMAQHGLTPGMFMNHQMLQQIQQGMQMPGAGSPQQLALQQAMQAGLVRPFQQTSPNTNTINTSPNTMTQTLMRPNLPRQMQTVQNMIAAQQQHRQSLQNLVFSNDPASLVAYNNVLQQQQQQQWLNQQRPMMQQQSLPRNQMHQDVITAAANVALNNAKNVSKQTSLASTPVKSTPIISENKELADESLEATAEVDEVELTPTVEVKKRQTKANRVTQNKPKVKTKGRTIISDTEEDELEDEIDELEDDKESVPDVEIEPPTTSRKKTRGIGRPRKSSK